MGINVTQLVPAGYTSYKNGLYREASGLYQKCIYDSEGRKRYFINFTLWDLSVHPGFPSHLEPLHLDVTVQFYKTNGDAWFDVSAHIDMFDTLDDLERFYEHMWSVWYCGFYE